MDAGFDLWLRDRARAWGFQTLRTCSAEGAPGIEAFDRFVAEGRHGQMEWMPRGRAPRADPRLLLPTARSAAVLAMDYGGLRPPDPGPLHGRVASYAWGRDYHNLIGKRLRRFCAEIEAQGVAAWWSVDSRPALERAWAERAGLGFIGKSCLSIIPGRGSTYFLAVLLLSADLPADPPRAGAERHCGACTRCLVACPTQAYTAPGQLDARRCISYLTIEHRGELPAELEPRLGRWVFGCDVCQDVCPHNHRPPEPDEPELSPRPGHAWLDLSWLMLSDDADVERFFEGSPIRRARAAGLKRNGAAVLGNSGQAAARPLLERGLQHPDLGVRRASERGLVRLEGDR
jgi:epoxyqueuosine reductase